MPAATDSTHLLTHLHILQALLNRQIEGFAKSYYVQVENTRLNDWGWGGASRDVATCPEVFNGQAEASKFHLKGNAGLRLSVGYLPIPSADSGYSLGLAP